LSGLVCFSSVPHDLLILGASARAAAWSALRCRLLPRCADYFADLDLAAVAIADRIDPRDSTREFEAWAAAIPPSPWLYTGAIENHPDLVERISARHRLWGVDGPALRRVRDPIAVADVFAQTAIPRPDVRRCPDGRPRDGSWLQKPLKSAGGRGIEPLTIEGAVLPPSRYYYQERIVGPSFSALFIGDRSRARLIGATKQLIGFPGCPFGYRGSIGPWALDARLALRLQTIGAAIASAFGLAGWFGVDYVLRDEIPWPVEINPRYTASVEVHELATGCALLNEHRRVCEGGTFDAGTPAPTVAAQSTWIAKVIVHAPQPLLVPSIPLGENEPRDPAYFRSIADVPPPGSRFETGDPVVTLLTSGETAVECWKRMVRLERAFLNRLEMV
jgi:predicted ATP-grasp superfamily ATP-dependent carboligase